MLFIDASQAFEKQGNQNVLSDEQVEDIVAAYENRQAIDKYAYVATLDEIAENDYNLNIPRYVDTFEEEEAVDIEAVVQELKALDVAMQANDKVIAGFCQELGISTPF